MGSIDDLIAQARHDPESFQDQGRSYEIVRYIFNGEPAEKVVALLHSKDIYLIRIGVEVAEELGREGHIFIDDVRDLYFHTLCSSDLSFKYDALELMASSCMYIDDTHFRLFVAAQGDMDIVIVRLALRLLSYMPFEYIAPLAGALIHDRNELRVYIKMWDSTNTTREDIDIIEKAVRVADDVTTKIMIVAIARMMVYDGEDRVAVSDFVKKCLSKKP